MNAPYKTCHCEQQKSTSGSFQLEAGNPVDALIEDSFLAHPAMYFPRLKRKRWDL